MTPPRGMMGTVINSMRPRSATPLPHSIRFHTMISPHPPIHHHAPDTFPPSQPQHTLNQPTNSTPTLPQHGATPRPTTTQPTHPTLPQLPQLNPPHPSHHPCQFAVSGSTGTQRKAESPRVEEDEKTASSPKTWMAKPPLLRTFPHLCPPAT